MNKRDKYFLIDLLRIIAKSKLNYEEKEFLKSYFENITADNFDILTVYRNRVEYLLAFHYFDICKDYECSNKILKTYIRAIDSQLGYLQYKYHEYIDEIKNLTYYLERKKVCYALLKGFSLIDKLYKFDGIIYRNFTDCDILIDKRDSNIVHEIITKLNFFQGTINSRNEIKFASRNDIIYWSMASHQEYPYIKKMKIQTNSPYKAINLDINTTILEGGRTKETLNTSFVLEHRERLHCGNVDCWGLNSEFQLIQLCYHFYKDTIYETKIETHANLNLIKFCDIMGVLNTNINVINWEMFLQIINKYNIADKVLFVLNMVVQFYNENKLIKLVYRLANDSEIELRKYDKDFWLQIIHC